MWTVVCCIVLINNDSSSCFLFLKHISITGFGLASIIEIIFFLLYVFQHMKFVHCIVLYHFNIKKISSFYFADLSFFLLLQPSFWLFLPLFHFLSLFRLQLFLHLSAKYFCIFQLFSTNFSSHSANCVFAGNAVCLVLFQCCLEICHAWVCKLLQSFVKAAYMWQAPHLV